MMWDAGHLGSAQVAGGAAKTVLAGPSLSARLGRERRPSERCGTGGDPDGRAATCGDVASPCARGMRGGEIGHDLDAYRWVRAPRGGRLAGAPADGVDVHARCEGRFHEQARLVAWQG